MNRIEPSETTADFEKNLFSGDFLSSSQLTDFKSTFDTLVNTIPDGLFLLKDAKIKYANSTFA
ncbi:MAG TPA: hypothetical protein VF270_06285, partial [Ignavibacteriaceae bacterium]